IYFAFYRLTDGQAERLGDPDLVRPEELPARDVDVVSIPQHLLERLPQAFHSAQVEQLSPSVYGVARAAEAYGLEKEPEPLVPLYLRRPDAKEPAARPRSAAIPEVEL